MWHFLIYSEEKGEKGHHDKEEDEVWQSRFKVFICINNRLFNSCKLQGEYEEKKGHKKKYHDDEGYHHKHEEVSTIIYMHFNNYTIHLIIIRSTEQVVKKNKIFWSWGKSH